MDKKPKFDLSNPGGQPKDWLQRSKEADAQGGGGKVLLGILALLAIIGGIVAFLVGMFSR